MMNYINPMFHGSKIPLLRFQFSKSHYFMSMASFSMWNYPIVIRNVIYWQFAIQVL